MAFKEQTKGVPAELIQQGWRSFIPVETYNKWLKSPPGVRHIWQLDRVCTGNGLPTQIGRPCTLLRKHDHGTFGPCTYSHEGWGDGLAPTPEMAKIWQYWWLESSDIPGNLIIVEVILFTKKSGIPTIYRLYDGTSLTEEEVAEYGDWQGPVLPPMRRT